MMADGCPYMIHLCYNASCDMWTNWHFSKKQLPTYMVIQDTFQNEAMVCLTPGRSQTASRYSSLQPLLSAQEHASTEARKDNQCRWKPNHVTSHRFAIAVMLFASCSLLEKNTVAGHARFSNELWFAWGYNAMRPFLAVETFELECPGSLDFGQSSS